MRNLIGLLLILLIAFPPHAWSINTFDRAQIQNQNLIGNPGAESGLQYWSYSGFTPTLATSAGTYLTGKASLLMNTDTANDNLTSALSTVPESMWGNNGYAYCRFQTPSGTATHTISVLDGSANVLAGPTTITSSTIATVTGVNFIFPNASGTVQIKINAVASDEPEITIDDCYIGLAANLTNVSQAEFYASAYIATTAGCVPTITSTSLAFPTHASCPGPTADFDPYGKVATTDNNGPAFTMTSLPPGNYEACISSNAYMGGTVITAVAINDGTSTKGQVSGPQGTTATQIKACGTFTYTSAANRTFSLYASSSSSTFNIENSASNERTYFTLTRWPLTSEQAFRPDVINWKVDANITGAIANLSGSDVTTYTGIEDTGLTLTNNTSTGNNTAWIPCSTTVAASGTTCSSGSESIGVYFYYPIANQVIDACVDFSHYSNLGASGAINATFQIVETTNSTQTIIQEGKTRIESRTGVASTVNYTPFRVCGTFSMASAGYKTLRLMYEQDITATVSANGILADADANNGQRDVHWTVRPADSPANMPVLVGGVTNSGTGQIRVESAKLNCDSSSSTTSEINGSDWINGNPTNISTGSCTATINTGIFSSTPYCQMTETVDQQTTFAITSISSTSITFKCRDGDNVARTACDPFLTCIGAR